MTTLIEISRHTDPIDGTQHDYRRFAGSSSNMTHHWRTDAPLSAADIEALRKDPHCFDQPETDPEAA